MNDFRKLLQEVKHYLSLQKEYALMDTADKLTTILSAVAVAAICFALGAMVLFFLAIALAFWLGALLVSIPMGFVCISLLMLVLALVAYSKRNEWVVQPLARMMIRLFANKEEKDNE